MTVPLAVLVSTVTINRRRKCSVEKKNKNKKNKIRKKLEKREYCFVVI